MTTPASSPPGPQDLIQKVVQANKDHQYALKVYTERLEAELEVVDKLLTVAEQSEGEVEIDAGGELLVPESIRAVGPFLGDVQLEGSYFCRDAERRDRYLKSTWVHPMRPPELDALTEAVTMEAQRFHAYESHQLFQQPSSLPVEQVDTAAYRTGIDWNRIAAKVSHVGSTELQRSALECEIQWRGCRHPRWNHSDWTQQEVDQVRQLVDSSGADGIDWVEVTHKLGTNRTPVDCMRHAIDRRVHTWTPETDARLIEAVKIYGTENWMLVARMVSDDATPTQCQNRYTRSLDPTLARGSWAESEDAKLRQAVEVCGHSWLDISTFVLGRTSEQCRERWQDFLNPTVSRTKWTDREEQALLRAVAQVGEGKWKEVSQVLNNGRTDNMCRARYLALMKRKQKKNVTRSSTSSSEALDQCSPATPTPETQLPTTAASRAPRAVRRPRSLNSLASGSRTSDSSVSYGGHHAEVEPPECPDTGKIATQNYGRKKGSRAEGGSLAKKRKTIGNGTLGVTTMDATTGSHSKNQPGRSESPVRSQNPLAE